MSASDVRARLAEKQAALVQAVAAAGDVPAGFDADRVRVTARALLGKRRRTVARSWPRLAESLGEELFRIEFLDYARCHPLPSSANPYADGYGFARWFARSHCLADAARLELAHAEVIFSRWRFFRLIWLKESRRLVLLSRRRHLTSPRIPLVR